MWTPGHAQAGWLMAWASGLDRRDRSLAAIAGALPDLDALSLVAGLNSFHQHHHVWLHNLPAAFLLPALCVPFARRRLAVFEIGVGSVLLHLLSDGFGLLRLVPLWPFSGAWWWPNGDRIWVAAIGEYGGAFLLLGLQVWVFRRSRTSILEMLSPRLDAWIARQLDERRASRSR